ncbi:unnamed protein product, partial [Meganyctiphanes norvegica]
MKGVCVLTALVATLALTTVVRGGPQRSYYTQHHHDGYSPYFDDYSPYVQHVPRRNPYVKVYKVYRYPAVVRRRIIPVEVPIIVEVPRRVEIPRPRPAVAVGGTGVVGGSRVSINRGSRIPS